MSATGRPCRRRIGVGALLLCALGCDPFGADFAPVEPAQKYRAKGSAPAVVTRDELLVMTYNVKFGGGRIDFFFDCHGDRVLMSRDEVGKNLEAVARKIRQVNPDVLFLQEVDVASKRSAYVDQLQVLLDGTDLHYAVYASQWRADFVPSDGIGAVDSGNAILAKVPLLDAKRIALSRRTDQDSLERYFYLRRNLLTATLDARAMGAPVALVATHAEAYSKDGTKLRHIERFEREMRDRADDGPVLGGGDLNALPPFTVQVSGFDDSACTGAYEADDYSEERDWLERLYERFDPAVELADYEADNAPYFSHTTSKDGFWNRKLDYLFTNGVLSSGLVHQDETHGGMETMPLSDHAPLSARFRLEPSVDPSDGGGGP